jgi:hypothetical protein
MDLERPQGGDEFRGGGPAVWLRIRHLCMRMNATYPLPLPAGRLDALGRNKAEIGADEVFPCQPIVDSLNRAEDRLAAKCKLTLIEKPEASFTRAATSARMTAASAGRHDRNDAIYDGA